MDTSWEDALKTVATASAGSVTWWVVQEQAQVLLLSSSLYLKASKDLFFIGTNLKAVHFVWLPRKSLDSMEHQHSNWRMPTPL